MGRLDGKVAIVTGGSRGLGRAIVERFVEEGATVVTGSTRPPETGIDGPVTWRELQVSHRDSVDGLIAATREAYGGFDILVNNAGIEIEKTAEESTDEDWERMTGVNMQGVFLCTRAAIPVLRERGGGSIVNLASISALVSDPHLALYNASKTWVLGFTRSVAVDHGKDGIRCNCIAPGWMMTDMLMQTFGQARDPDAAIAAATAKHPLGRLGEPRDIANAALFLASDDASFVSGHMLVVDGALTAQPPIDPNLY